MMNKHTSTSLLGAAVVLLYAGCGSRAGTTRTTHTLRALSSISDGAALSSAVPWTGIEAGAPVQDVDRVEFVIDGRVRWTERQTPYVFNGHGNELFPWVLGAGAHRLAVRVVTRTGATATTAAAVTVALPEPVPSELLGTFTRRVTRADVQRTQAFRREPADRELPAGTWRIRIAPGGPRGSRGSEAFSASPAPPGTHMNHDAQPTSTPTTGDRR